MGTGASTTSVLPPTIDKTTAKSIAGNAFDEKAFESAAKGGAVSREAFLQAAPAAFRCAVLCAAFDQNTMDAQNENKELSKEEAAKLAADSFWEAQSGDFWTVPMAGGDSLFSKHCGLLAAVERARRAGKTPLLIDNSEDRLVDTFYTYQPAQVLDAKKLLLEERQGTARSVVMEGARAQLVKAIRYGHIFYVRLANSACDFVGKYNGADTLPLEIFHADKVAALNREFGSAPAASLADEEQDCVGANLFGAEQSPFAAVLRADDAAQGAFVPRRGLEVVLCTHFGAQDFGDFLSGKLPMDRVQPIAVVQLASPQSTSGTLAAGPSAAKPQPTAMPTVEELLAPVEACRKESLRASSKEAKEALEAALRVLLTDVGTRELPRADVARLDQLLAENAQSCKTALIRPLNACAVHGGLARLPVSLEQVRRMLSGTPPKGATGLMEVLMQDMEVCKDLQTLEAVRETLELLLGHGRLHAAMGAACDPSVELPAAHREACKAALLKAQKRHDSLRAWKRAQNLKAQSGFACVRFEERNEAFDVTDRHDGRGYVLDVHTCERIFQLPALFEGAVSYALVQEDVGSQMDVRIWVTRPPVEGRDGPPSSPDSSGCFCRLKPDAQYRLEATGTRRKLEPQVAGTTLGGAFGKVGLLEEDDAAMVALTCTCQVGKPCGNCTATAFG